MTGAAQVSRERKRLDNRIRISGLMIQPEMNGELTAAKKCVTAHS
jgi:hypothetical protein